MEPIEVQYEGEIEGVSLDFDMASRCEVMRAIDRARREGQLKHTLAFNKDALFKMDNTCFKILTNDQKEDVLLRLPIHQISHISYLHEDQQQIIVIKYGEVHQKRSIMMETEEEMLCRLAVILCETKTTAERLCSSGEWLFEEAVQKNRQEAFEKPHFSPAEQPEHTSTDLSHSNYSFLSSSCSNLHTATDDDLTINLQQQHDVVNKEPISASLSRNEKKLIMEYMEKLYKVLDRTQLERFADLVGRWHADLPFEDFLSQLITLYGPRHHHLLAEMKPFIPAKDLPTYEAFIQRLYS